MKGLKLKVCGMRDPGNILEVASLKPDYMGFIFYEKSPRFVGNSFMMPDELPSAVSRIGVFVNAQHEEMLKAFHQYRFEYLQLHGNETPEDVARLKDAGAQIIKVFSVDDDFDFEKTKAYEDSSDFFLFDTKGKHYGGNAATFQWKILERYNQKVPFFLSGGLNASNIELISLLRNMNLHALDVNSGVETQPGVKSKDKIIELITALTGL